MSGPTRTLFERCAALMTGARAEAVTFGGSVLVEDGSITAVGRPDEVMAHVGDPADLQVVDCRDKVVLPGLVNAHNHNAWGVVTLAPFADPAGGLNPYETLDGNTAMEEFVLAPMAWFSEESTYDLTVCGMLDQIRHGTTTTADAQSHPDAVYAAAVDTGIRAVLHPQMITSIELDGLDETGYLDQAEDCLREYHVGGDDRVTVGVHPNWPWNCTARLLTKGMELAERYDAQFATHLYEVADERRQAAEVWSEFDGGIDYLDSLGLISERSLFFHGIELDEHDVRRLAAAGCSLVHNPELNLQLWGRTARIRPWLDAGMVTGLGTDYGQFDLFSAMKLAGLYFKIVESGAELDPWLLLSMATVGSARALWLEDRVGTLEPGKRADVITIDVARNPSLLPYFDDPQWLAVLLTTQAGHIEVADSMVDGVFLRRDGEFTELDVTEIVGRGRQWCEKFVADYRQMRSGGRPWHRRVHEMFSRT